MGNPLETVFPPPSEILTEQSMIVIAALIPPSTWSFDTVAGQPDPVRKTETRSGMLNGYCNRRFINKVISQHGEVQAVYCSGYSRCHVTDACLSDQPTLSCFNPWSRDHGRHLATIRDDQAQLSSPFSD